MKDLIEIRWHGRGGQGAKTASLLLADAAFNTGKYIQGFPEYGPERMGAPITAYNRISTTPIRVHSNIYEPDYVVVIDDTLLTAVDVTSGLKEDGAIIINTTKTTPDNLIYDGFKYECDYKVDNEIFAEECVYDNNDNLTSDSPDYCDPKRDDKNNSKKMLDLDIVYRIIDLDNPFPGKDGNGRYPGDNWSKYS